MNSVTSFELPHEDQLIARTNLWRWLNQAGEGDAQSLKDLIPKLEGDRRPGFLMLTATLKDGRVVTCDLDLAVTYTKPWLGIDEVWPWVWR